MNLVLRPLIRDDWPDVARIYREGIDSGNATFETEVPTWEDWDAARSPDCRIVAEGEPAKSKAATEVTDTEITSTQAEIAPGEAEISVGEAAETDAQIAGFAALSPVSRRPVYAGVREAMIYVAATFRGQGVGSALLQRLVRDSEAAGVWTLQAGIFPENRASIRVFEKNGFVVLGVHRAVGRFHDGRWRDVVLMERRSAVVGLE